MPDDSPSVTKALELRLNALVRCVLRKAHDDPTFADQLGEILFSDSLRGSLRERNQRKSASRNVFNPVECLQTHGLEHLRQELGGKPSSELSDVVRFYRILKGREAKALGRAGMVEAIVAYSERSLNQGGSFLRDKGRSEAALEDADAPSHRHKGEGETPNAEGPLHQPTLPLQSTPGRPEGAGPAAD